MCVFVMWPYLPPRMSIAAPDDAAQLGEKKKHKSSLGVPRSNQMDGMDADGEYVLEQDREAMQMQGDDEDTLEQEEAQQLAEGAIDRKSAQQGDPCYSRAMLPTFP